MKIALVYNLKRNDFRNKPFDYYSEFDSEKTIDAIKTALETGGHKVELVEADGNLFNFFKNNRVDFVFNIAEGINAPSRESQVPALLDFLNIPHTGSGVLSLALALDKAKAKQIFQSEFIPTPLYQLFSTPLEELNPSLSFPLIVKPSREGSSKGISVDSVVNDKNSLYEQIENVLVTYGQRALVEEFIGGKELTVAILDQGRPVATGILEIDFSNCRESGEYFYSWRMKEYQGDKSLNLAPSFFCPATLDEKTKDRVKDIAVAAHKSLGCLDYSRVDIRLGRDGIPFVLEVNPLPGLDPDDSNFTFIAKAAGINYNDLINEILNMAVRRSKLDIKDKDIFEKIDLVALTYT